MQVNLNDEREETMNDNRRLSAFLRAVEDFGNMSTGQFISRYPDYQPNDGYGYIQKWGRRIARTKEPSRG